MLTFRKSLTVVFIMLVAIMGPGLAPRAVEAQAEISEGCARVNERPVIESSKTFLLAPMVFNAGDTITITASAAPSNESEEGSAQLEIPNETVVAGPTPFPASLSYTFPADVETTVAWSTGNPYIMAVWNVSCTPASSTPGAIVPGCDLRMPISTTAVVGAFVANAPVYWEPGALTNPLITIPAGKTAWVLGTDSSGEYYRIIWSCSLLWVPQSTMAPNHDTVWHGKQLPTGIVD